MNNYKNYLFELTTEDLPYLELEDILDVLNDSFIVNFKKLGIDIIKNKSFITVRRIAFLFVLDSTCSVSIKSALTNVFEYIKFNTNMRWSNNKKTFVRPIKSYVLMCEYNLISHSIFDIKSNIYTIVHRSKNKSIIKINPFNYYDLLKNRYKIILCIDERKKIFEQKLFSFASKFNCNILLDNKIFTDIANSFEYLYIDIIKFSEDIFELPQRIIIMILLYYNCVPLIKFDVVVYFLTVIETFKKKKVSHFYKHSINNKLLDIK